MRELSAKLTEGEKQPQAISLRKTQHQPKADSNTHKPMLKSMKDYNRSNTDVAKKLRKKMTPWERKLWYEFLRTYPIRFQRQKPIGNRIVDFYCAKAELAIELDGGGHFTSEQQAEDQQRTTELVVQGVTVLRFINYEVATRFHEVCERIDDVVKQVRQQ